MRAKVWVYLLEVFPFNSTTQQRQEIELGLRQVCYLEPYLD